MSEETKSPPPLEGGAQPAAPKPAAPAAAAPPKPAPPAKPAGPVPVPWDSPLVAKYKRQFGSGLDAQTYLGQNYFTVDSSLIPNFLQLLRDEEQFDYCVDITALHYPKREKPFDLVQWQHDYDTDVKAITAQTTDVRLFTDQVGSWTSTSAIPSPSVSTRAGRVAVRTSG